jgi:hypothetical protein
METASYPLNRHLVDANRRGIEVISRSEKSLIQLMQLMQLMQTLQLLQTLLANERKIRMCCP